MRPLILFMLLPGCGLFGGTLDRATACEHDVFGWWGGLTTYVDQGKADGDLIRFDLDPPANWMVSAVGEYDTTTGDFSYEQGYVPRHLIAEWSAEGYGTVYSDGDVDLLTQVSWVDVLGQMFSYAERDERSGCRGTRTTWAEGGEAFARDYTIRSEDRVDYRADQSTTSGGVWSEQGAEYSGGRSTSQIDYDYVTGTYSADRETQPTGDWEEEFAQLGPDYDYIGSRSGGVSGGVSESYEILEHGSGDALGRWSSTTGYDGSGSGTWSDYGSGAECALSFAVGGACTYSCDDGSSGSC